MYVLLIVTIVTFSLLHSTLHLVIICYLFYPDYLHFVIQLYENKPLGMDQIHRILSLSIARKRMASTDFASNKCLHSVYS